MKSWRWKKARRGKETRKKDSKEMLFGGDFDGGGPWVDKGDSALHWIL